MDKAASQTGPTLNPHATRPLEITYAPQLGRSGPLVAHYVARGASVHSFLVGPDTREWNQSKKQATPLQGREWCSNLVISACNDTYRASKNPALLHHILTHRAMSFQVTKKNKHRMSANPQ